jgi:hypothetical protein
MVVLWGMIGIAAAVVFLGSSTLPPYLWLLMKKYKILRWTVAVRSLASTWNHSAPPASRLEARRQLIICIYTLPQDKLQRPCQVHAVLPARVTRNILTLNSLSRIKSRLGQVEELVCSRMKYSRLYVILLHLVLSAKSVYNF